MNTTLAADASSPAGAGRPVLVLVALAALASLLIACAGANGSGPGWTFVPPGPTPQPTDQASPGPTDGEPVGTVIELEMTTDLRYTRDGQVVDRLELVAGEEYTFRVDNVAGFSHDIWLGPPDRLAASDTQGLPGLPEWESGIREFSWTATEEAQGWQFGCTVPGHYLGGMYGELALSDE